MIQVQGLSYQFQGTQEPALRDVNLKVDRGEFVVLTGPSGCGKSTLALAIGGYLFRQFDGHASGTVLVDGLDVRQSPIYDVAEIVGLVQQNPENQFCTLTVQDEVAFGLENRRLPRQKIQERLEWALGIAGAGHLLDRALATLSGGEKQKVAVAAMMATKPQVLIFDEPTSNLDPTATAEIFGVIDHIRATAGITVLVIEHKVHYLKSFAPRIVTMEQGRVVSPHQAEDPPLSPQTETIAQAWQEQQAPSGPEGRSQPQPAMRIENLHVNQGSKAVLKGISLEIRPGEFVAVLGDNGSGKTTFLQSLLGLLRPERGRVEIQDQDIRQVPVSELARTVGFVFQNPDHQIFADSVWQEATFALDNFGLLDDAHQAKAKALLTQSGLGGRLDDHPYRLSYGQKRRLNLVSVLAYAPQIVLLDEILIGQDPSNAHLLLGLLEEHTQRGNTVVMVNHAPQYTRRFAQRILFFDQGNIVIDAPTCQAFDELASLGRKAYLPPPQPGLPVAAPGTVSILEDCS